VDPLFLPASYGYRPNKSALDAVGQARQMCWAYDWVCDLDIKGLLRQSRSRFDDEGGPETRARAVDGTLYRALAESAGAR
jgi:hypothetical protein